MTFLSKKHFMFLLIFCFSVIQSFAQGEALTNADIIELKKAGFSEKLIISKIESEEGSYKTTTKDMIALKKAGISDAIITAMVKKNPADGTVTTHSEKKDSATADRPKPKINIKESGIFYRNNKGEIVEVDASIYSAEKASTFFANIAAKTKASVRGAAANLRAEPSATFFFTFPQSDKSELGEQSVIFTKAKSPNEFTLVRFEIIPKKNERSITTAQGNFVDGVSAGIDEKQVVLFKYRKLKDGQYEVYFDKPLPRGEYAFMYSGSVKDFGTAGQKLYDFGVD